MSVKRKPTPGLQEALDRLAALFENGALDAATRPAVFIDCVTEEIKRLRGVLIGLQWQGSDAYAMPCCPSCGREPPDRDPPVVYTAEDHNNDCDIGPLLGGATP